MAQQQSPALLLHVKASRELEAKSVRRCQVNLDANIGSSRWSFIYDTTCHLDIPKHMFCTGLPGHCPSSRLRESRLKASEGYWLSACCILSAAVAAFRKSLHHSLNAAYHHLSASPSSQPFFC
jgi:hypothetical protein